MENILIEEINPQKNGVGSLSDNGQQTPTLSNQGLNYDSPNAPIPNWVIKMNQRRKMTIEEQRAYRNEHWDEIMERIKQLDIRLSQCEWLVTDEEEVDKIVSNTRREMYEQSLGH